MSEVRARLVCVAPREPCSAHRQLPTLQEQKAPRVEQSERAETSTRTRANAHSWELFRPKKTASTTTVTTAEATTITTTADATTTITPNLAMTDVLGSRDTNATDDDMMKCCQG